MNGNIEHKGVIVDIIGHRVDVSVIVESACLSCKARTACGMDEGKEKVMTIIDECPEIYSVGELVNVTVTQEMGVKALFLAYLFPFLFVLGTLIIMLTFGFSELVSGLISLMTLGVYYFILYLMRNKIEKEIIFKLRKI